MLFIFFNLINSLLVNVSNRRFGSKSLPIYARTTPVSQWLSFKNFLHPFHYMALFHYKEGHVDVDECVHCEVYLCSS